MVTVSSWLFRLPVIELETRSPVGGTEQSLNSTGQVDKEIAHEEKPEHIYKIITERKKLNSNQFAENTWFKFLESLKPHTWRGWGPQHQGKR